MSLARRLNRESPPAASPVAPTRSSRHANPAHHAVVIGYGPTGRTVVRLLRENGIAPTVIDLNMDNVRALRQEGVR